MFVCSGRVLADDGGFLGAVMAPTIDAETRTMELGYVIAPHARGRGVASEGLRLLTEWAFEQGAERLELLRSRRRVDPPGEGIPLPDAEIVDRPDVRAPGACSW